MARSEVSLPLLRPSKSCVAIKPPPCTRGGFIVFPPRSVAQPPLLSFLESGRLPCTAGGMPPHPKPRGQFPFFLPPSVLSLFPLSTEISFSLC